MNSEDIKILENLFYDDESFEPNGYVEIFLHKNEQEAIKHLIARNKELETINKMQEYRISVIDERELISKSKVRELQDKYKNKIEKLESKKIWNEPVDTIYKNRYTNYYNAYEELLQKGDK